MASTDAENVALFWSQVKKDPDHPKGCWEWQGMLESGYGRFNPRVTEQAKNMRFISPESPYFYERAHRYAWRMEHGEIPDGLIVRHFECDNPKCCRVSHLRLGTHADNAADRDSKGRRQPPQGSQHGRAKLTEEQIPTILQEILDGVTDIKLGKKYGVDPAIFRGIKKGKIWRKIPRSPEFLAKFGPMAVIVPKHAPAVCTPVCTETNGFDRSV